MAFDVTTFDAKVPSDVGTLSVANNVVVTFVDLLAEEALIVVEMLAVAYMVVLEDN